MKREKHSLSHYKLLTCNMGQLVPVSLMEALPGDTFQHATSMLVRFAPMLAPVMHPVQVRIHHWFVPLRLLYTGWEDFITGGPDGTGSADPYPTNSAELVVGESSLGDYLGLKPATYAIGEVNMMPFRAYNMIFNEFYRDEDLVTEALEGATDLLNVAWEKDYFTTARPWASKGPAVVLPLGTTAPVVTDGANEAQTGAQAALKLRDTTGSITGTSRPLGMTATSGNMAIDTAQAFGSVAQVYPSNLFADLTGATAVEINQVREAFALQRYQEARAQYGHRYTEYLRYLGVTSSDARLQRPEYLGGGKTTVAISEVLQTATGGGGVGSLFGHGVSAMRSNRYRYFCEEHGYIVSLLSVRPRTMYLDGMERLWSRRTKEEYYQKELELIGQQEVLKREVFKSAAGGVATDDEVFGYQDRYAEYRRLQSKVAGEFRSTLDFWHLGRKFAASQTLNGTFVESDPSTRIFASAATDTLWCMVSHQIAARRMVGKRTIGRVI